jgi:hypothetical protein
MTPCASPSDVKTVIAGQSHAGAIARSLITPVPARPDLQTQNLARTYGLAGLRGAPVTPDYWATLTKLGRARGIAIVWNGNQYNADFLLAPDGLIDLVPRDYPDTSPLPGARLVPEAVVREHFGPSLRPLQQLMPSFGHPPGCARLIVGTPPPIADNEEIRRRLFKEPSLTARAKALDLAIDSIQITPPSVRRKLWFVLQKMMEELAVENAWKYVPVSESAFDSQGFLLPNLSAGDVTHANIIYGALMVRQIVALL